MINRTTFKEDLIESSFADEFIGHLCDAIAASQSLETLKPLSVDLCSNAQHVVNVVNGCRCDLEVILRNSIEAMNSQLRRVADQRGVSVDQDSEAIFDYVQLCFGQSGIDAIDDLLISLGYYDK